MRIDVHLEKVRRFEVVRRRLSEIEDFELWFWASLSGGTHALNAALHAAGVTDAGDYLPTQVVGVYLEPVGDGGTWKPGIRFGCDIIHVGMPPIDQPLPVELERACGSMEVLEALRDPCVRGDREVTSEVVMSCDRAYRECLRLASIVLRARGWSPA